MSTTEYLINIVDVMNTSDGNPDREFFYLGGPMSGIKSFNFPRFQEIAGLLRDNAYNIVSPAEIDDPETEAEAWASEDGAQNSKGEWVDFLARDIIIVSLPNCKGGIFLEGWEKSKGAKAEIATLRTLDKDVWAFDQEGGVFGGPRLTLLFDEPEIPEWVSSPGAVEWQPGSITAPLFSNKDAVSAILAAEAI